MKYNPKTKNYEPPKVDTYNAEDLLEKLGPVQASSFGGTDIRREY